MILCVDARVSVVSDSRVHRAVVKRYVTRDDGVRISVFEAKSEEDGSTVTAHLINEDVTWARGWSSRAAKALRATCAL